MLSNDSEKDKREALVREVIKRLKAKGVRSLRILTSNEIRLNSSRHYFATGGYGDIFKGTMSCDGGRSKLVAVKVFRGAHIGETPKDWEVYLNRLSREYDIWGRVTHRNVLRLEGLLVSSEVDSPGIVSEYKEHGDLFTFLRQRHIPFDRLAMARGIACGLQHLHAQKIVHGDLTPLNILVDMDAGTKQHFPLITDFGKSRVQDLTGYTTNINPTPAGHRPPELLAYDRPDLPTNKELLTYASDVYSFSLILLQLLTDKEAYTQEGLSCLRTMCRITDGGDPLRPTPDKYPLLDASHNFCWPIMQACWKHHPRDRITSEKAYNDLCGSGVREARPLPTLEEHAPTHSSPKERVFTHNDDYLVSQLYKQLSEGDEMLQVVPLLRIITVAGITLDHRGSFAAGGYADIYKGTMLCDGGGSKSVAVKVFRAAHLCSRTPEDEEMHLNRLRREYEVWGRVAHRNVLRLEGLLVSSEVPSPSLVSEYKEHGDLDMFLQRQTPFDRLMMAQDVACGLQYLHAQKVIHGGLTLPNILVDKDASTGRYFPLITDFAKSRVHERMGYTTACSRSSILNNPPELLAHDDPGTRTNREVLTFSSDVYSFSLVLLRLITDKAPYTQEEGSIIRRWVRIIDQKNPLRPTPENYPLLEESHNFCWPIMQACWKHHPEDRITSKEAYERLRWGPPPPGPNWNRILL